MNAYWDKTKAVDVKLDAPRKLYFNIGLVAELENNFGGRSILHMLSNTQVSSSISFLTQAYHVGLKTDDRGLTLQRVQDIFSEILMENDDLNSYEKINNELQFALVRALQNCGVIPKKGIPGFEFSESSAEDVGKPKTPKKGKD